ncbi:MAG: TIGR03857 family LLM class F420-dependent oxidoreductase [Gammaproteobacteria bacterium]
MNGAPQSATAGRRDASVLGAYVLPGGVRDPRPAIGRAKEIEVLGMGTAWIGERFDTKDLPALAGALSQVTSKVEIASGVTPFGLRHPMVLASMGQTLQSLSAGRFALGLGRSARWRWTRYGTPAPTLASMRDTAVILRRLWAGETVEYDGPAGRFPSIRLAERADVAPPPLLLAAVGPRTLALAGASFDGVILHPFLTVDAVHRSCAIVRDAARQAGRDPHRVRCIATLVVAPDRSAQETDLAIRARAAGYFHVEGLGDALIAANGWSAERLARYRAEPVFADLDGRQADKALPRQALVEASHRLPAQWVESASASGSSTHCAEILHAYLDAGADRILLHGTTPEHLAPMVRAFTR